MSQYYIWGTGSFSSDKMNGDYADLICVIDDKVRWNILRAYQLVENFPKKSDVMVQVPCGFYIPAVSEELKEDIGDGWKLVIRKDNPWPAREPLALSSPFQPYSYDATKCLHYPNTAEEQRCPFAYIEVWKAYVVIHERYVVFYALANQVGYEDVELSWEAWGGSDFKTKDLLKALDLEFLL